MLTTVSIMRASSNSVGTQRMSVADRFHSSVARERFESRRLLLRRADSAFPVPVANDAVFPRSLRFFTTVPYPLKPLSPINFDGRVDREQD
jgi:hypothetical protein